MIAKPPSPDLEHNGSGLALWSMLILNETVAAGDDIAGRIDRLRHALSLWSRIMA